MIDQLKSSASRKANHLRQARDEACLNAGIRETQMVLDANMTRGSLPFFDGTHWTLPAPPELIQAAEPALPNQTAIRSTRAALPTVMPTLASNGWVRVSST
jgi:hypothetical protein